MTHLYQHETVPGFGNEYEAQNKAKCWGGTPESGNDWLCSPSMLQEGYGYNKYEGEARDAGDIVEAEARVRPPGHPGQ